MKERGRKRKEQNYSRNKPEYEDRYYEIVNYYILHKFNKNLKITKIIK